MERDCVRGNWTEFVKVIMHVLLRMSYMLCV